jgi:ornithine carbamoyltransferase
MEHKDLLGLYDMSRREIELILDTALPMKDVIQRGLGQFAASIDL